MKTWGAMNDVAWVDYRSHQPMGMAGRADFSRIGCIAGMVVPALAGDWYGAQDCLLSEDSGCAGVVIMSDRAVMERQTRQVRRKSVSGYRRQQQRDERP